MAPVVQGLGALGDDAFRVRGEVMHRRRRGFVDGVIGVKLEGGFAARADGYTWLDFDGKERWEGLAPSLEAGRNCDTCRTATLMFLCDCGG